MEIRMENRYKFFATLTSTYTCVCIVFEINN